MMIPILLAVSVIIFTLMYFVPGDPASISTGGEKVSAEQLDAIRESMGLNRSYIERLVEYVGNVFLRLDFGTSYTYGTPVGPELLSRFWNTAYIGFISLILMMVVGIPVGVRSAVHANKPEDRVSMFTTLLFNSMPPFWLALLLVLLFSLNLGWLPSTGAKSFKYFILPSLSVALGSIAGIARQTRSSMLEVIRSDYVTTARAKGLSERKVVYGNALPNALIPIITVCGNQFGKMLGGVVVIETIFSIPGLGVYMINGINNRDYNVVQGALLVIALMFSVIMLITDLVYAYVDPRIKARYMKSKKKMDYSTDKVVGDADA